MTQPKTERPVLSTAEDLESLNHGTVILLTEDETDYAAITSWGVSGQFWLVTGEERYFTTPELLSYYEDADITLLFSPEANRTRG